MLGPQWPIRPDSMTMTIDGRVLRAAGPKYKDRQCHQPRQRPTAAAGAVIQNRTAHWSSGLPFDHTWNRENWENEENFVLGSLFDFIRDAAILVAAVGLAKWAWDQHKLAPIHRDGEAKAAMAAERLQNETRQWNARMEAHAVEIAARLAELIEREKKIEQASAAKIAVHHLLQSTTDPFLSFVEIEAALRTTDASPGMASARQHATDTGTPASDATSPLSGQALRRILMDLVSDGVIAQLDRDRYFIASDFETGDDHDSDAAG